MNNFILIAAALVSAAVAQAGWHAGNMPNGWVEEDCSCDQHHHLEHKPHHHEHKPHHEHHHEHHYEHKPHHHEHHRMRTRTRFSSFSSESVLPVMDMVMPVAAVAPAAAGVQPVIVTVQENSPVYTVDPNGQGPYPNGLTMDIFTSCNDNKGFIAKRGDGIYTELYSLKAAGQTKPVLQN